jgi:hypothetical protein
MTTTHTRETPHPNHPLATSDFLLTLVVTLLAPVFLGVTAGDIGLARLATLETVNDYRARNHADLMSVGQIVGFGLAALGSLGLSMTEDLSLSMVLRLRGNAISCNRAAEQNRRARLAHQADKPQPPPPPAEPETIQDEPAPESDTFLSAEAAQFLAAESQARLREPDSFNTAPSPMPSATRTPAEKRHQQMWAIAMTKESSEIDASLPNLPPAEREAAAMRAGLLGSTAHDLIYGAPVKPFKPHKLTGIIQSAAGGKPPPR